MAEQFIIHNNDDINLMTSYWLSQQFGGKRKWTTLSHNGVLFPPEYVKHNVPVLYKGDPITLEIKAEEYATLYAKYYESEYINNSTFKRNFWKDWRIVLGKDHAIQGLEECNFKLIYDHLIEEKANKKQLTDEEKKAKEEYESKFKTAIVDGKPQQTGNFRIEPTSIFLGRGCNKKLGKVKARMYPEDVTINIGKESPIPETLEGHKWGKIVHDHDAIWLASWPDSINNKIKYLWLSANSDIKAESDMAKFDLARKLKRRIKTIRAKNEIELKSDTLFMRQIATALYFIDRAALRVGNEKSSDETDTVGVTSLRVEHLKFLEGNKIELDFLGKDSIRYKKTLSIDEQVYKNLMEFTQNKTKDEDIFDKINSNDINRYLQTFMPHLTAKVFRTYNASALFQRELKKITAKFENYDESDKINLLLDEFNKANAKVAILCNHQKNVNKSNSKQIDSINASIKKYKKMLRKAKVSNNKNPEKIALIEARIKKLKSKKDMKIEMKNISISTSRVNYIDNRISVAFIKKHNLPIEKIFSPTLQERFKWAFAVDENFKF
jgi:DNA topoisomerase I